jgi:hypothetical protein
MCELYRRCVSHTMCSKHLFRKGVSPCNYMRAKMLAARSREVSEDERVIQEFLAKVRVLLAETYARVDGATRLCEKGGGPAVN